MLNRPGLSVVKCLIFKGNIGVGKGTVKRTAVPDGFSKIRPLPPAPVDQMLPNFRSADRLASRNVFP